jgi:hypothetical protein
MRVVVAVRVIVAVFGMFHDRIPLIRIYLRATWML